MIKLLLVALAAYFLYAFISAFVIYAFENPNAIESFETFTEQKKDSDSLKQDRVQLIESEKDGILVRLNLIENAKKSIDMSYFTFRNGEISRLVLGSLLEAAKRGVKVRILLDSLSSLPSFATNLKDVFYGIDLNKNIQLKFYDPINPLFPFNWSKRLHDKMIIVDDNLALVGGRNVADKFYIKDNNRRQFSKDRDVIIFRNQTMESHDSVIIDMKNYYNKTWDYKFSKSLRVKISRKRQARCKLSSEKLRFEYNEIRSSIKEKLAPVNWYDHTTATDNVEFVHNPVGEINHDPWCLKELLYLASQAKSSIFMQSPYFIPTRRVKNSYKKFDIDSKMVTILTNSYYSSPNHIAISAYANHRNNLINNDVNIHEYQKVGSLHGKTYIFDDRISAIGSFNLDARSSFINSEILIVITSQDFAKKLKREVQFDLDNSLSVAKDLTYKFNDEISEPKLSRSKTMIISILSKISPILEHIL